MMIEQECFTLWKGSKTLFSVYSTLSKMDYQFRNGLQIYAERMLSSNSLLFPEVWKDRLSPEESVYRANLSSYTYATASSVLRTQDVFKFLAQDINAAKEKLGKSITAFISNENLAGLQPEVRDQLMRSRLKKKDYYESTSQVIGEQSISDITFMGNFHVFLDIFEENILKLRAASPNRQPPYQIPEEVLREEYAIPVPHRFSTLRNALSGSLDFHNETLTTIIQISTQDIPKSVFRSAVIFSALLLLFYLLFIVIAFYFSKSANHRLFDILSQYRNLKSEEVETHRKIFTQRIIFIERFKLDEIMMIANHMGSAHHNEEQILVSRENKRKSDSSRISMLKSSRKFRSNLVFKVSKMLVALSLMSTLVVIFIGVILYIEAQSFLKVLNMQIFYSETYESLTDASHLYLAHSMYIIFGNFIQLSGTKPSELLGGIVEERQVNNLRGFLVNERKNLLTFFGKTVGQDIDTLLFKNVCLFLDKQKSSYPLEKETCESNQYAQMGFVAFLEYLKTNMKEIRGVVGSNQEFLTKSQTDWLLFPFQTYLYSYEKLSFRIVNKIVFETVLNRIFYEGELIINSELDKLESNIIYLNRVIPPLLIVLYTVLFIWRILRYLKLDMNVSVETLHIILPSILIANKQIYKVFTDTYNL